MFDILKTAAIEINKLDASQTIKVAGVLRKLWNWFKQLNNPLYREKVEMIKSLSTEVRIKLRELEEALPKLQSAISDADVEAYQEYLERVKTLSKELSGALDTLGNEAEEIQQPISAPEVPTTKTPATQQPISDTYQQNHRAGYDMPLGAVNVPFKSSEHLSQITESHISISESAMQFNKRNFKSKLEKSRVPKEIIDKLLETREGLVTLFSQLIKAIPNGVVIYNYYPAPAEGRQRAEGQMELKVRTPMFELPEYGLKISALVWLVDQWAQVRPEPVLSIKRITNIDVVYSGELERRSSRITELLGFMKQAASRHQWARNILMQAFREVMGREPTLAEIQGAQAVGLKESGYGAGWIRDYGDSRAKGSNNWGAVQAMMPKGGECPAGTFLYQDTRPTSGGTNVPYRVCFKAYSSPVEGAKDLIKKLYGSRFKGKSPMSRGEGLLQAARKGSLTDFSTVMYDSSYYQGWGKTREARIANHIKYLYDGLKSIASALNEPIAFTDISAPKTAPPSGQPRPEDDEMKQLQQLLWSGQKEKAQELSQQIAQETGGRLTQQLQQQLSQSPVVDNEMQSLERMLWADTSVEMLVKNAVANQLLEKTNISILIFDNEKEILDKYAKVAKQALDIYLGATNLELKELPGSIEISGRLCKNTHNVSTTKTLCTDISQQSGYQVKVSVGEY